MPKVFISKRQLYRRVANDINGIVKSKTTKTEAELPLIDQSTQVTNEQVNAGISNVFK